MSTAVKNISLLVPNKKYYWRVKAHNSTGWSTFSPINKFTLSIAVTSMLPTTYSFNFSNFKAKSNWFCYTLPVASQININIYNIQGKLVYKYSKHYQNPGYYKTSLKISELSK
ncbi:MAG TPA: hypothetical protein VHO70_03090, partial [Chitinispirillaceae bacterium]|nr:hypothetical protein [Chitinispirillaceae bacterium]